MSSATSPADAARPRKVLYVSGTRADYGPARGALKAIEAAADLELGIVVCGMHLDPLHGETWKEIEADGLKIVELIEAPHIADSLALMAARVGRYLEGMSAAFERHAPDIALVLGDRGEALAGAMAAAFQNIVVVHLCGGSISGSIDDSIRHAITKFAHVHLVASRAFRDRVIQLGEPADTVHLVGLPGGDLRPDVTISREELAADYGFSADPKEPYALVIQHPVTHSRQGVAEQIAETLEACVAVGIPTLLANPNDDAGGRAILATMQDYAARHDNLRIVAPPKSRERFASLMAHAGVLVGNSSAGTVEAMSVKLPVVNVGDRQRGRSEYACLLDVDYARGAIAAAMKQALDAESDYRRRLAAYESELVGEGTTEKIVQCLRTLDLGAASRPKVFGPPPTVKE